VKEFWEKKNKKMKTKRNEKKQFENTRIPKTCIFDLRVPTAAAYAVEMRTVDRADIFELSQTGLKMSDWAANQKAMFWTEVEKLRLSEFQRSANAPYFTVPDPDEIS